MGFVTNISDFGSLAIVGLEKNTGKTECLNYILGQLGGQADRFALTSVGIDGESRDQVCQTAKPEIEIPEGMIFVTSEKHYREKRLAPLGDLGSPVDLARVFGGGDVLRAQLERVQSWLYAA